MSKVILIQESNSNAASITGIDKDIEKQLLRLYIPSSA